LIDNLHRYAAIFTLENISSHLLNLLTGWDTKRRAWRSAGSSAAAETCQARKLCYHKDYRAMRRQKQTNSDTST